MAWSKRLMKHICVVMGMAMLMTACSVSYKFNGSSIDYTKIKTISFETFPNRSIADGYSTMAELRMTVRVTFVNTKNPQENFEAQQFTSSREYDASQQLASVQDELVNQMIKDIVDQIFNATVANW